MFKKLMFAAVPMLLMICTAQADDVNSTSDAALEIDVESIADASVEILIDDLDLDVDQLAADAGTGEKIDAVEACFRRCGYRSHGWGGYSNCWNSGYRSCYSNYSCYQPYYSYTSYVCARPVYYTSCICQPICSYWGCY